MDEQSSDEFGIELAVVLAERQYVRETRRAKAGTARMQQDTHSMVDTILTLKRFDDFIPPWLYGVRTGAFQGYFIWDSIWNTIRRKKRLKEVILTDYDGLSERYENIDARIQRISSAGTRRLGRLDEEQSLRAYEHLKPTLEELTSAYRQRLQTIDNYRRQIIEWWQFLYPKKEFPRDTSGLYEDKVAVN